MLGYLSADIICSEKQTIFRERSSRKTVSFEEQIMSADKYPSIFSPQMETIVFIIPQIFYASWCVQFWKLEDILGYPPVLAGDIWSCDKFRPIVHEQKDLMDYNTLYYCSLKLSEIQNLVPIAPKQEKNLNLRLQRRNGEKGRKAWSKGCLIKTDNLQ